MRTERNKDGTWNVWMSRDEYRELPRATDTFQQEIALRLMGDCGLRVAEVLDVKPKHISRRSDGRNFELEVVAGKDTTGEYSGGKHRETWLPRQFEAQIHRYTQEKGIGDSERLVDKAKRTVQELGRPSERTRYGRHRRLRLPPCEQSRPAAVLGESPAGRRERQPQDRHGAWWVEFLRCYRTVSSRAN